MIIVTVCLFIAACFPFVSKMILAVCMSREGNGYDNRHPRTQQQRLTGFGARALAAHQNSFEALLIFGIAILSAMVTNSVNALVNELAITYIIARLLYHTAYILDFHFFRSFVWFIGFVSSMTILGMSISW